MTHTFLEAKINAARDCSGLEVTAFLDGLIWSVEDAVSTMACQCGILAATDADQIFKILVHDKYLLRNVNN